MGKDQLQHLEITRDVASRFHAKMGETFVIPEAKVEENILYVPGTDGSKMSKSKDNTVNIFQTDKKLRKQIMGIQTDSTPLEEPKNPDTCNVFNIYKLLGSEAQTAELRQKYEAGGFGYGHAKQALFELVKETFAEPREKYEYYINNLEEVDKALAIGKEKATTVAKDVLKRVREKLGY